MTDAIVRAGLEERFAEAKATKVRYFVGGAGAPVVLVHGLGGAAANWAPMAQLLVARHRVLALDLPGHGGSAPLAAAPTLNPFADCVRLVAHVEGLLPAFVVGHSLGAVIALRTALRHPSEIRGVVLAGAAGITSATRRAEKAMAVTAIVQPARLLALSRRPIARSALLRTLAFGRWGASNPAAMSPVAVEAFLAETRRHTDTTSAAGAMVQDDPRVDLGPLPCPCLVLWGARDALLPVGDAFQYARRLRAELRVIADCGHLLIGERPDACADAISEFARSTTPTGARQ